MALTVLFGTDASVTFPSGGGALFSAFSVSIAQGLAQAAGFGDTWIRSRGTIKSASGSVSGFTTSGTTADAPGISGIMTRTGSSLTLTFYTGCTLACNAIFTQLGLNVVYTGNQSSDYAWASDGAVTETWATT